MDPTASVLKPNADIWLKRTRDRLDEACLLSRNFDSGGVQVLVDEAGEPWWARPATTCQPRSKGPAWRKSAETERLAVLGLTRRSSHAAKSACKSGGGSDRRFARSGASLTERIREDQERWGASGGAFF